MSKLSVLDNNFRLGISSTVFAIFLCFTLAQSKCKWVEGLNLIILSSIIIVPSVILINN